MSGRKNVIPAHPILTANVLTGAFQTVVTTLTTATHVGFLVATSGVTSGTGTFQVQFRMYKDANNFSPWCTLSGAAGTLNNADDVFFLDVSVVPGQVRVIYTPSGTPNGTVTIWVSGCEE